MKLNNIALPLVLALATVVASTGCHKGFNGQISTLHGPRSKPIVGEFAPVTKIDTSRSFPTANPIPTPTANPIPVPPDRFPTAEIDLRNYTLDRVTFAAQTVHFKFDSSVVQDKEQANVAKVAQGLADPTLKLLIEGNCDERGTEEYNRALGERRALSLREALAKDGLDPARVKTISYGKDQPEDQGHDEAAWAKNRRGVFVLLHPKPVQ